MAKTSFNFQLLNRRIHLFAGLIMVPYIFIFGLSGVLFNHPTFLTDRTEKTMSLGGEDSFSSLFPNLEKLTKQLTDSIVHQKLLSNPTIENIEYSRALSLRSTSELNDYRIQIDIPTSKAQVYTLPKEADDAVIAEGNIAIDKIVDSDLIAKKLEEILQKQGIEAGESKVQRMPDIVFDLKNSEGTYRVYYSLSKGDFYIENLAKRNFKISTLVRSLHQEHGYPISGVSAKWLWIFFADLLSMLMMVWAVTGLIMWVKMKRMLTIGVILLTISLTIFILILMNSIELGY